MKIKQTIHRNLTRWRELTLAVLAVATVGSVMVPATAGATKLDCAILPQFICDAANTKATSDPKSLANTGIFKLLTTILTILTAGVGLVAVGVIVYAGAMYASASNDAGRVQKAKDIIRDVIIGLVVYGFMFLILNFLIPGGVLSP